MPVAPSEGVTGEAISGDEQCSGDSKEDCCGNKDGDSPGETPPDDPPETRGDPNETPLGEELEAPACIKIALVMDLGDEDKWFLNSDLANNFSDDADSVGGWVEGAGFTTTRISQYWGNDHTGFKGKGRAKQILGEIAAAGASFAATGATDCCHEFFLYISAHGGSDGLEVYDTDGGADTKSIAFTEIFEQLLTFPDNVHVIFFLDSCKAGGMIGTYKRLYAARLDAKFAMCGVTLLTSTDSKTAAAGGQSSDSGTEDFMEGADEDHDVDGKKGDIRDRFTNILKEGPGYNPQWYHSGPGSWSSLD